MYGRLPHPLARLNLHCYTGRMFKPVKRAIRRLNTKTKKAAAALVLVSGTGTGTAAVAPDSFAGRIQDEIVGAVHSAVNTDNATRR